MAKSGDKGGTTKNRKEKRRKVKVQLAFSRHRKCQKEQKMTTEFFENVERGKSEPKFGPFSPEIRKLLVNCAYRNISTHSSTPQARGKTTSNISHIQHPTTWRTLHSLPTMGTMAVMDGNPRTLHSVLDVSCPGASCPLCVTSSDPTELRGLEVGVGWRPPQR